MDREQDKLDVRRVLKDRRSTGKDITSSLMYYFKKYQLKDSPVSSPRSPLDKSLDIFGGPLFTK
jgi:hypothetical protein